MPLFSLWTVGSWGLLNQSLKYKCFGIFLYLDHTFYHKLSFHQTSTYTEIVQTFNHNKNILFCYPINEIPWIHFAFFYWRGYVFDKTLSNHIATSCVLHCWNLPDGSSPPAGFGVRFIFLFGLICFISCIILSICASRLRRMRKFFQDTIKSVVNLLKRIGEKSVKSSTKNLFMTIKLYF